MCDYSPGEPNRVSPLLAIPAEASLRSVRLWLEEQAVPSAVQRRQASQLASGWAADLVQGEQLDSLC